MIDIHTHLIDGGKDLETSLTLLRIAAEAGTTDIIATPAISTSTNFAEWRLIREKTENLQMAAKAAGISLNIYAGAELEMDRNLLGILRTGQEDYCLAGSRYILIKLPQNTIPSYAEEFFYEIQVKELIPVVAHPERHYCLVKNPEILHHWMKESGVLVQSNVDSFSYKFGIEVKNFAELLLRNNMVNFLGSDAESIERRSPDTSASMKLLRERFAPEILERISDTNARAIIENRYLDVHVPKELCLPYEKSKSFLSRLFG